MTRQKNIKSNWDVETYRSKLENDLPYFLKNKVWGHFMTSSYGETNQGGDTID